MIQFRSVTYLVTLVVLLLQNVEGQDSPWMKPSTSGTKGGSSYNPQVERVPQPSYPYNPAIPQVQPVPQPNYPKMPEIQPAPQPNYPQRPEVRPAPQPNYPKMPEIQPAPQPNYPKMPEIQPAPQPNYPQRPEVRPAPQPSYPQKPQIQPAPQPSYPQKPQIQPAPQPSYPQKPQIQPAPQPSYPQKPQIQPVPQPSYPQKPQIQPVPQPHYPQKPQIQPVPQPQYPQRQNPYQRQPSIRPAPKPQYQQIYSDQSPQEPSYPPQQPQEPQQPKQPERPYQPQKQAQPIVPRDPDFMSCEVDRNARIPCGGPDISAAGCDAINCCFDGQQCYFGKAVTVQCTKDAQFIVVVARDATLPNIDLETISLLGSGQGCTHVDSNSQFAIYQFPVTSCGSLVMEEPGVIVYENRMTSSFEVLSGDRGRITRDSNFELLFQCRYTGTSVETLVIEVLPLQDPPLPAAAMGPINVELRLANGECTTKGCDELQAAYTSFYMETDYPVTKVLRDPVYVEVRLLGKTDPNLVLSLGRCWTTTSPNPHSMPQWDILVDGCPNRDDRYRSLLVPIGPSDNVDFPSHHRRFIFKMFTFVDPNTLQPTRELVYIHCSTSVCTPSAGHSCDPSCFRRKRDLQAVKQQAAVDRKVVVSSGPVSMMMPEEAINN